jgi:energy-coupling factor transporter transmembrane protein EcfT
MRFDISSKLSATLFLILCAISLPWQLNAALFVFLAAVGVLSRPSPHRKTVRTNPRTFQRFLLTMIAFVLLITILNGLFLRGGKEFSTPLGLTFYEDGLTFGLTTSFRLAVISAALVLFFTFTPLREFVAYLQQKSVPSALVVILFLSLHFVGQLPERIAQIFTAQEARGAPVRGNLIARTKAFASILSPLVLSSIIETLDRGAALEARGFSGRLASHQPPSSPPVIMRVITILFLLASLTLIVWTFVR